MKLIGIATENFSMYYELVRKLKERNISFVSLSPEDVVSHNVGVIITTKDEYDRIRFRKKIACEDASEAVDKALQMLMGKTRYKQIIIGIDPGEGSGIAVIGDGALIQKHRAILSEIQEFLRRITTDFPSEEYLIRIGSGAPLIRNQIINLIFQTIPQAHVEMVDESRTTVTGESDTESAMRIASQTGTKMQRTHIDIKPTSGEIRDVQRRSRILAGDVTISKALAERVLKGEISLDDAVKMQRKNKRV